MVKKVDTKAQFDEELSNAGAKLVVVDFYADWCGPCKMISPIVEGLATELPDVVFLKVNVDENEDTASEAGIQAMPTFKFYKNGEPVGEMVGANPQNLKNLILKHK